MTLCRRTTSVGQSAHACVGGARRTSWCGRSAAYCHLVRSYARMDRVRIGIIGVGNIATLNVPGYLEHEQCDVVALCDPRPTCSNAGSRSGTSPRATPTSTSCSRTTRSTRSRSSARRRCTPSTRSPRCAPGKHVSCQKPIANTVGDARAHGRRPRADAERVLRVTEHCCHYPPLRKARDLIRGGVDRHADGDAHQDRRRPHRVASSRPTSIPAGYTWRFNAESPGGHLFDDVMHKYAMALWLVDDHVRSVQAVVRQGPLFFEAPTVALFEYARDDLLGMMEVSYAPDMFIRSDYYGADEFFEIQGTRGFVWVTRLCGNLHVDLAPLVLYEEDGRQTSFAELDASYDGSFRRAAAAFVDGLLAGETPDLDPRDGDRGAAALLRGLPGVERAAAASIRRRSTTSVTAQRLAADRGEAPGRRRGDVPARGRASRAPGTEIHRHNSRIDTARRRALAPCSRGERGLPRGRARRRHRVRLARAARRRART